METTYSLSCEKEGFRGVKQRAKVKSPIVAQNDGTAWTHPATSTPPAGGCHFRSSFYSHRLT